MRTVPSVCKMVKIDNIAHSHNRKEFDRLRVSDAAHRASARGL